jgi:hypothetical protein
LFLSGRMLGDVAAGSKSTSIWRTLRKARMQNSLHFLKLILPQKACQLLKVRQVTFIRGCAKHEKIQISATGPE